MLHRNFRFIEEAAKKVKLFQMQQHPSCRPLEKSIAGLANQLKLKRLGFESASLSYNSYCKLKKALQPIRLIATTNLIEQLRVIKSQQEIKWTC